jgi:HD superfamily phosphohydrolase
MDNALEQIQRTMRDAGCTEAEVAETLRAYQDERPETLLRLLRKCRCNRMEELHESQRRVDRLDYLIRQTQRAI